MTRLADALDRLSGGRWMLLLVLLSLITRLGWSVAMHGREYRFDEVKYLAHAERLAHGQGYVNDKGEPTDYWPVGFPLALAAAFRVFGDHPATRIAFQIVAGTLICVVVSLVGERVSGRSIGRLAALIVAIYPNYVFYSTLLLTEPIFTLLVLAGCALLLVSLRRWSAALVAGGLFGMAILTRPVFVLFPLLTPFWCFASGAGLRRAVLIGAVVSCAALGVLSPWLYRNHRQFGSWTDLSSIGGADFYLGNNRDAFGDFMHPEFVTERLGPEAPYNSSFAYRLAWADMRAHPVLAVRHAAQKVTYFVALETDGALWNLKGYRRGVPLLITMVLLALANVPYLLLVGAVTLGVVTRRPDSPWTSLSYFVGVYLLLMAVVFIGDPRYHFSLIPFAALVVARVIVQDVPLLHEGLRRRDAWAQRCLRRWALASGALVSLMIANLWLKYLESQVI